MHISWDILYFPFGRIMVWWRTNIYNYISNFLTVMVRSIIKAYRHFQQTITQIIRLTGAIVFIGQWKRPTYYRRYDVQAMVSSTESQSKDRFQWPVVGFYCDVKSPLIPARANFQFQRYGMLLVTYSSHRNSFSSNLNRLGQSTFLNAGWKCSLFLTPHV